MRRAENPQKVKTAHALPIATEYTQLRTHTDETLIEIKCSRTEIETEAKPELIHRSLLTKWNLEKRNKTQIQRKWEPL